MPSAVAFTLSDMIVLYAGYGYLSLCHYGGPDEPIYNGNLIKHTGFEWDTSMC